MIANPSLPLSPSIPSTVVEPIRRSMAAMPVQGRRDVWPVATRSYDKRLIVEGRVQATVRDCHEFSVRQPGTFKGNVDTDIAEIAGQFQGTLTVHDRLLIRSTGRVDGEIRYDRLEIEGGGELTGQVTRMGPLSSGVPQPMPAEPLP